MGNTQQYKVVIKEYDDNLELINKLGQLIEQDYSELFHSVIVHGSVATNEVIAYSDFDGLLVVKDNFISSKKLEKFKTESMKLILEFDPLQHHGWFQIRESQLKDYPQYYLPYEILENSKLIIPKQAFLELNLTINKDDVDYKRSLKQLIGSINIQSRSNFESVRIYDLKSFLSKVMLLPSMYYAAKYNKGIFKKESFTVVKNDFMADEWSCMDKASFIRYNWNYSLIPIQKFIMTRPEKLFRRLTKKYVSPRISDDILKELDANFFKSLNLFIEKINKDIFAQ